MTTQTSAATYQADFTFVRDGILHSLYCNNAKASCRVWDEAVKGNDIISYGSDGLGCTVFDVSSRLIGPLVERLKAEGWTVEIKS